MIRRHLQTLATLATPWRLPVLRYAGRLHGSDAPATILAAALPPSADFVAGALLVAHEDVADRAVEQRVVHGQDATPREPEDGVDALHLEGLDQCLRSGELHVLGPFLQNENDLPSGRS